MVTKSGGDIEELAQLQQSLADAGLTPEQALECQKRFIESPFDDYAVWCRAYVALNTTDEQSSEGILIDGNLVIKAMFDARGKKPVFKVSKKGYKSSI